MTHLMTRLFLLMILLLAGCNVPSDDADSEQILTPENVIGVDVVPTSTPTIAPTRTAIPRQVPTSINAPTDAAPDLQTQATAGVVATTAPATGGSIDTQFAPLLPEDDVVALQVSGGVLRGGGVPLLDVNTHHYSQNPANLAQFSVVDSAGMLYITERSGANAYRVEQGPYTQFPAPSRAENNAAADRSAWSNNGQYVAFVINAEQQASDGVWFFQPGQFAPLQLIVDCPFEGARSCMIVRVPDATRFWKSREVFWSPDSQTLLVNADLPEQGRRGLMIRTITRDERVRDERPPMIYYDYGTWGNDGRILASGRNPDGVYTVDWLDAGGNYQSTVYVAGNNGLWMGWAVQQADGDLLALGRPGNPDGPIAIYDMNGTQLTDPIGDSFPSRVVWSPDRRYVLIEANGRRYIAGEDGLVQEITAQTGAQAINWVIP